MDESNPVSQKPGASAKSDTLPVAPENSIGTPPVQPQPSETVNVVDEKQTEIAPPQAPGKRRRILWAVAGFLLIAVLAAGGYFFIKSGFYVGQKVCTQEAKVCPDGTSVGRTGLNCEFAPCPNEKLDETTNWKTLNNIQYQYSLKYPDTLKTLPIGIYDIDETTATEIMISSSPADIKPEVPTLRIVTTEIKSTVYKDKILKDIVQDDYDANKANKNTVTRMLGDVESLTFAGEPAFTFQMESNGFSGKWMGFQGHTGTNKVLEFQHNGLHFTIVYSSDPIFDQILSTFKFLDPDTSSWKTFTSQRIVDYFNPFNITYPPTWTVSETRRTETPQDTTVTLQKNDNLIRIIQGTGGGGRCVFEGEPDFNGSFTRYKKPIWIRESDYTWSAAKPENQTENLVSYRVCGNESGVYLDSTKIGWIDLKMPTDDLTTLNEFVQILMRVEILQ